MNRVTHGVSVCVPAPPVFLNLYNVPVPCPVSRPRGPGGLAAVESAAVSVFRSSRSPVYMPLQQPTHVLLLGGATNTHLYRPGTSVRYCERAALVQTVLSPCLSRVSTVV